MQTYAQSTAGTPPSPSPRRFNPVMEFYRPLATYPASMPVTLLVPEHLCALLTAKLERYKRRRGLYVGVLLARFRTRFFEREFLQSAALKCHYQRPGQELRRFCLRVPNEAWMELGQWASFLGVSRCLLFAWLLEEDLCIDPGRTNVRVPTNALQEHDSQFPLYLEFSNRVYLARNHYERAIRIEPAPEDRLPYRLWLLHYRLPHLRE